MAEKERETIDYSRLSHEELVKKLRQKDLLISILSHDLINSFNTLLLSSKRIYADQELPEKFRRGSRLIVKASERAYEMLENLRWWARYKTGYPGDAELIENLKSLIDSLLLTYADKIEEKGLVFAVNIDEGLCFESDRSQLYSILKNLISNAIKFSPVGGVVSITNRLQGEDVLIDFANQGEGISEDRLQTLFSPEKVEKTLGTLGEPGLGFGLMLTKELVEHNGGAISCESKVEVGVLFTLSFPYQTKA